VGWPLPTALPTVDQIQLSLRSGIDPQLLVDTLAVIVWFTWAQLVATFAAEAVAAARGRTARRLPVLPGLQPAVAQTVAAITLAVATLGPLRALPAVAAPLPAAVSLAAATPTPALDPRPVATAQPDAAPDPGGSVEPERPMYRVGRFDTFWQVADSTLGDGRRWAEIRDLNIGRTMPDGHRITQTTDRLTPGWLLILPNNTQPPNDPNDSQDPVGVQVVEVTVERGDNFWTIAQDALHTTWGRTPSHAETTDYWRQLVAVNRDRLAPPHDPDLIYPGQRFALPPIPTESEVAESTVTADTSSKRTLGEVTVERGDNFWSIAQATLAEVWGRTPTSGETTDYWHQLVAANRHRLAPPHDPNLIYPGQRFDLPAIPHDPQAAADTDIDLTAGGTPSEPAGGRPG
jgi:nucleoid-associated protein YgaU